MLDLLRFYNIVITKELNEASTVSKAISNLGSRICALFFSIYVE